MCGIRSLVRGRLAVLLLPDVLLLVTALSGTLHAQNDPVCFPETGYCIEGRLREFWVNHGGLFVFGYPITPQRGEVVEGQVVTAQWFERNRLELHPENPPPYDVLIGRVGADRLLLDWRDWYTFPRGGPQDGCLFFEQTGHRICGDFLAMWRANGLEFDGRTGKSVPENLALYGLPLSEPQAELLSDGKVYTVQWFERARFELHPENPPPYHVLLGLLGKELHDAQARGGGAPEGGGTVTTITPDSTILAPPRASEEQAVAYILKRGTPYSDYSVQLIVSYYWKIAPAMGVDPVLALAQCLHETDTLRSWWAQRPRRNPAGLGVTGETSTTPPPSGEAHEWAYNEEERLWRKGLSFENWDLSARAHVGRLLAYALRDEQAGEGQRALINEALSLRPLPAHFRGVAPTLRGLNGRWAYPGETYADRIVVYANGIVNQP